MSDAELATVERAINDQILANTEVATRIMSPDEAIKEGAQALFGEKYGDEVRVVSMGTRDEAGKLYSLELCGGTHVNRTGEIGLLHILKEEGPAAGVRRIEAITGPALLGYLQAREGLVHGMAESMRCGVADLPARVDALQEEKKRLERELADTRKKLATGGGGAAREDVAGVGFIAQSMDDIPAKELKGMADELKAQVGSGVVVLIATDEGKGSVVVGVTDDLADRLKAGDAVKAATSAVGGSGGGRPTMAQGSMPAGADTDVAVNAIKGLMMSSLG